MTSAGFILLANGDEYCTADAGYQRFRRIVRNQAVQRAYLSLPLSLRQRIANTARQRSTRSNQYKSRQIMDVTPQAIEAAFQIGRASRRERREILGNEQRGQR